MKAQELRIGNIVAYQEDGRWFEVYEIDELGLRVRNKDEDTWIEHEYFEPIPLTPEILEKCEKSVYYDGIWTIPISDNFVLEIVLMGSAAFPILQQEGGVINLRRRIHYLHQLQNLFFALTGEELTFNP